MTVEVQAARLRCAVAVSTEPDAAAAIDDVCRRALDDLGAAAHLALVFISHQQAEECGAIASRLAAHLDGACLLGCTGETIVGGAQEFEDRPAIALWLAHLPGVELVPMHLRFEQTAEGGSIVGWPEQLTGDWPEPSTLLLLAEPFSFPADVLLARLDEDRPGVPVAGGMASGGWQPGQNRLLLGDREITSGAVAVRLSGAVRVRTVVSQGCRPIGQPYVVTKAQQNVIEELGGRPALVQLSELFARLTPEEQQLVRQGLHVGSVTNEYRDSFARGDFLVRNVIGSDRASGAIAIGDYVRVGQTVQFHVRDAATADEDLRELLAAARAASPVAPRGALLFTCNGRGTRMFAEPHHDAAAVARHAGDIPVAGFFAQGEIGPIGGRNFVHGFTASVALFEPVE